MILDTVKEWLEEEEDIRSTLSILEMHGCASGMVAPMIYYTDTLPFYTDNVEEINKLLQEIMQESGTTSIKDVLPNFDDDDPLVQETHNTNLLAWFGFEVVAGNYYHSGDYKELINTGDKNG